MAQAIEKRDEHTEIKTPAERELHQKMQSLRAHLADDKQASLSFLQRAGILTAAGNLAKAYR